MYTGGRTMNKITGIGVDVFLHDDTGTKYASVTFWREKPEGQEHLPNNNSYNSVSIPSYLRVLRAQQKYFYLGPISGFNECDCKLPDEICRACEARFALTPLEGIF
jgi:hypothetical protein